MVQLSKMCGHNILSSNKKRGFYHLYVYPALDTEIAQSWQAVNFDAFNTQETFSITHKI